MLNSNTAFTGMALACALIGTACNANAADTVFSFKTGALGNQLSLSLMDGNGMLAWSNTAGTPSAELQAFAQENPSFGGWFSYDRTSAPVLSGSDFAAYSAKFGMTVTRNGATQALVRDQTRVFIGDNRLGTIDVLSVPWDFGPLSGGSLDFSLATPQSTAFDPLQSPWSFQQAAPALAAMPLHMSYSQLSFQFMGIALRDSKGLAISGTSLPSQINVGGFDTAIFSLQASGQASIEVLESDYANHDDYQLALDWVSTHTQRSEVVFVIGGAVSSIAVSAVPEPGNWALMLLGLGALSGRKLARGRRRD